MKGLDVLLKIRQAGKRPDYPVTVAVGDYAYRRPMFRGEFVEVVVGTSARIDRDQMRVLVGLETHLLASAWTERVSAVYEALQEFSPLIFVTMADFGDDLGWWWSKKHGRVEIGQFRWINALENALADATHAACKNDKAGYAKASANEQEARRELGKFH